MILINPSPPTCLSTKMKGDETQNVEDSMRLYNKQYNYYYGVVLNTHLPYVCILVSLGNKVLYKKIDANPDVLPELVTPYQRNIVIGIEDMHCWYWISDLSLDYACDFVLGDALCMKTNHGGKTRNGRIDSLTIALLPRAYDFPLACVYP